MARQELTDRQQRWGIAVFAAMLVIGTVTSFAYIQIKHKFRQAAIEEETRTVYEKALEMEKIAYQFETVRRKLAGQAVWTGLRRWKAIPEVVWRKVE